MLVGDDGVRYEPVESTHDQMGLGAVFFVPSRPGDDAFSTDAPRYYRVIAFDRDVLTGVSTIVVPHVDDDAGLTWYFSVDSRVDALLGVHVIALASEISGRGENALYDELAAVWGIADPDVPQRYAHVAREAARFTLERRASSPEVAAEDLVRALESGAMADVARRPAEPAEPLASSAVLTVAGTFASAAIGTISPFLGASVSAVFGVLVGDQSVSQAEFLAYAQVVQTQLSVLNNQLDQTEAALKTFVLQSDEEATRSAMANVTNDVNAILAMYQTQFLRTLAEYEVDPSALSDGSIAVALENDPDLRRALEQLLTSSAIGTLNTTLARYVPTIDLVHEPPDLQYLATLNEQLDADMLDLTSYGTFDSIQTAFTQYDSLYAGTALAVALAFDNAMQMYAMADYLSANYGAMDDYFPSGIPSSATLPACAGQALTTCVANAFVASNAQAASFMTAADLMHSSSAIHLPASGASGDGPYLYSCVIDDWQQSSTTEVNDGIPTLVSQSGTIDVTCTGFDGQSSSSTLDYTRCADGSIEAAGGFNGSTTYLSCNNTSEEFFSASDFATVGSIDTSVHQTIEIGLNFYDTPQQQVLVVYQTNDDPSANAWIQMGPDYGYLYDTGSTSPYIAVLQDLSTLNTFNLVYTYESMSLGCPNAGVGGYAGNCSAVNLDDVATCPGLCSCILLNGAMYYCLRQDSCASESCEQTGALRSCPVGNPEACAVD